MAEQFGNPDDASASATDAGVACVVVNRVGAGSDANVVTSGDEHNGVSSGDVAGEDGEQVRVRADKMIRSSRYMKQVNLILLPRAKLINCMCVNIPQLGDILLEALNAELPHGMMFKSLPDRIERMACQSEMVGELEIIWMSKAIDRQIDVIAESSVLKYGEA